MQALQDEIAFGQLRRTRRRATMLLAAVAALFVSTFFMGDSRLVGYVRAFAEAGMIGGLADWFAVVALFRHPLGIPIPHTAIIPNSKEGLGRNLARFIVDNFLDPVEIVDRLRASDPALRFGSWVSDPDNARTIAGQVATVAAGLSEGLASDTISEDLERILNPQLRKLPYGQIAARVMNATVEDGHHRPMIDAGVKGMAGVMVENRDVLRKRLGEESPWWVPEQLDDVVFDRAFGALVTFLIEVSNDRSHPLRLTVEEQLRQLADRLATDPELNVLIADRVGELLESDEVRGWIRSQWAAVAHAVSDAADRPESELRESIAVALVGFGDRLQADRELRERIDGWLVSLAGPLATAARTEAGALIAATVDRWDAEDTSRRLELWMGRDLQFVRINGTLVGGLAGVVIHTIALALGG